MTKPTRLLVLLNLVLLGSASRAAAGTFADPKNFPTPPEDAIGFPSRDPNLDAPPGFQNPPPGYGEVPFWWWTGDPLDKERLLWQIEQLHENGISGMQVNYAHEDASGWPTYAAEPEIFSEAWWDVWKFVADQCGKRGMGIGLSGYTLDWPNGKSLISRTIYSDPEIQGREIAIARKQKVKAGQAFACELPTDTVAVQAYPTGSAGIGPGNISLADSIQNQRLDWTPAQGDWEVWIFTAARRPGTPLSMVWFDDPSVIRFDVHAGRRPAEWFRFTAPPELRAMTLTARGSVEAWADGRPMRAAGQGRFEAAAPLPHAASVALRVIPEAGFCGAAVFPDPVRLECGPGRATPGDWSKTGVLECYSGGAWYRRTVALTPQQAGGQTTLDLGKVVATAEVRVNGQAAGIRVAPPWTVDLTRMVKPGENRIEILVYNTLANHYVTIPGSRWVSALRTSSTTAAASSAHSFTSPTTSRRRGCSSSAAASIGHFTGAIRARAATTRNSPPIPRCSATATTGRCSTSAWDAAEPTS